MGSRRRPNHIHTAAALQPSRLPIGTPTSGKPCLPRSQPHSSSLSSSSSVSASEPQPQTTASNSTTSTNKYSRMAVNHNSSEPSQNLKSIADAKLERQRRRIEEADAALRATSPPRDKRHTHTSAERKRAKHSLDDAHGPVSEVRISSIRVVSRESSLARPLSVLSQRTNDTAPSESETCDGFQIFRGRRNRKDEVNARGDKPEPRQATVEAAFDERDIYEAFGNALPAPEFIEENPGSKNGQLQFIQHPNGDVSAHQWSSDRYLWENIGRFSNIRRKVEGQLASDRLKGETAYRTLQQNTLAYFRTIAKQREAHAMGLPFGAKEIQAAIPALPTNEITAALTGLKESTREFAPRDSPQKQSNMGCDAVPKPPDAFQVTLNPSSLFASHSQAQSRFRTTETSMYTPNHSLQRTRHPEDPFCSTSPYQRVYGPYSQYVQQYYTPGLAKTGVSSSPFCAIAQHQLNYDFHFPPPSATSRTAETQIQQPQVRQNASLANMMPHAGAAGTAYKLAGSQNFSHPITVSCSNTHRPTPDFTATGYDFASALLRPDTPLGDRASMSDQLWKISETAKERNLSQGNISRTVLYDPYLKPPSLSTTSHPGDMEKVDHSLGLNRNNVPFNSNSTPMHRAPSQFFPVPLDSKHTLAASPSLRESTSRTLHDSSPDTYWSKKPYDRSTPSMTSFSKQQGTPQNFDGPFFPADKSNSMTSSSTSKKAYDDALYDWWTSGKEFARQEEFYQSIATAQRAVEFTRNSPAVQLSLTDPSLRTPVEHAPHAFNPTTTRLLVPVLENLASYVQGPIEKRRDYFTQWSPAPEWAIDRSENGNKSFYDADWGEPPARVGRDPRYSGRLSWSGERPTAIGRFSSPLTGQSSGCAIRVAGSAGLDRRFGTGGRF